MKTCRDTRDREEERKNSRRGGGEDGDEGVNSRVPESKGTSMCLAFLKGQFWIEFVFTVEMMLVCGEKGSKSQAGVALKKLGL